MKNKPTPRQLAVIRAMARGRELDVSNHVGSGLLTGCGLKPAAVSASDMTALLYEVEAIACNHIDRFPGDGYRLTKRGIELAQGTTNAD